MQHKEHELLHPRSLLRFAVCIIPRAAVFMLLAGRWRAAPPRRPVRSGAMWVITHVLAGLAIAAALGGPWWLVLIHRRARARAHGPHPALGLHGLATPRRLRLLRLRRRPRRLAARLARPRHAVLDGVHGAGERRARLGRAHRGASAASPTRKFFPSHWSSFPHGRSGRLWGIGVQVAIMAASVAVVLAARPY